MIFPASDTHFASRVISLYQREIYSCSLRFCRQFRCAVDIGAHVGIFTRRMEEDFNYVLAFEPNAENFRCLKQNTTSAKTMNYALMDRFTSGNLVNPQADNSGAWEFSENGPIQAVTLDSFELDDCDLIKIDVQGMENKVIDGARETIIRCKPVLIVENPAQEQLKELGYIMAAYLKNDFIFIPMVRA